MIKSEINSDPAKYPEINLERFKNVFVNRLILKYNIKFSHLLYIS